MSDEGNYEEEFDRLIDEYYEAEDVKTRVAALEDVIRLADGAGDLHGAFGARMEMIQTATFCDQKDKALVAFSWCLAQADRHPDEFDMHGLLWRFKWILDNLPTFADVSKQKIKDLQDDMHQRLLDCGYNLRPIHFLRMSNAMRMGELQEAGEHYEQWKQTTRDEMADCEACEVDTVSELLAALNRPEESIRKAEKLLDGTMGCAEVPHLTYAHLVRQYWKLGRLEELQALQPKWYRMVNDNSEFLPTVSELLLFTAATQRFDAAITMFEKHAAWAADTVNEENRFHFFDASRILFDKIAGSGQTDVRIRIPDGFAVAKKDNHYTAENLREWFQNQANDIACRFDARNENQHYQNLMAETAELAASTDT